MYVCMYIYIICSLQTQWCFVSLSQRYIDTHRNNTALAGERKVKPAEKEKEKAPAAGFPPE